MTPRTNPRWSRRIVSAIAATVMVLVAAPDAIAVAPCRVTNVSTQQVYVGTGGNLQTAINQASAGTTLRIRGTCVGTFVVGKTLTLRGVSTAAFPQPTLDANDAGTVLSVNAGRVTIIDLTITDGTADIGGGIDNAANGTVWLNGMSSVRGNLAAISGGGVHNAGTFVMDDLASVRNNGVSDGVGGGIHNAGGVLTLRGSSSVSENGTDTGGGGGIYNEGTLDLRGSSSVTNNDGGSGGGINNREGHVVRLHGSSVVSGNSVWFIGAGISNHGTLHLFDRSSIEENSAAIDFSEGGGVSNTGVMTMHDRSTVRRNEAGDCCGGEALGGAGIANYGDLTMRNASSVRGNTTLTGSPGGGITNGGTVTMRGISSIRRNTATDANGGGIWNIGTVVMRGASSIRRNVALNGTGGGIFNNGGTLVGAVESGNVSDNIPNDIAS
jgi:hypothetical protein